MAAWRATKQRGRIGRPMPALVGRRSTSWLVTVTLHGRSKGVLRSGGPYVPQVEQPFSANFGQVHVSW